MDKIIRKEKAVKKLQDAVRRKLPLMRPSQEMQNNMLLMRRRLPQIQDDVNNNSAAYIQKVVRGHISRRDSRNKILQQASNEKAAATTIQSAARNRRALKELYKREDRRDQYKGLINSGEIQEAAAIRENRRTKATALQSAMRNRLSKKCAFKSAALFKMQRRL